MNARIELLVSPDNSGVLPGQGPFICCPRYSPGEAPPWLLAFVVGGLERGMELVVKFAELSARAFCSAPTRSCHPSILK